MLQHEPNHAVAPAPYTPLNMPPASPEELAQAIVAVEARQGSNSQAVDLNIAEQTLQKCRLDVTPEQLLDEVRTQRARYHQDAAMTQHKLHETPFRLLLAGGIVASAAVVVLLFVNYLFLQKLRESSTELAKYQVKEAQIAAMPSAAQLLQKWAYPGAVHNGSGSGGHLNSLSMTTKDSYAAVWKYYATRVAGPDFLPRMRVNGEGIVPNLGAGGSSSENGRPVEYEMASSDTQTGRTMTFTSLDSQSTVSGIITGDPAGHATTIKIIASTPKPLP